MRKTLLFSLVFVFCLSMACPIFAADLKSAADKVANGTMEVIKSPLVLHDHTKSEIDDADHKPLGFLKGLIESPFHMVKKAGSGMLDIATFPID